MRRWWMSDFKGVSRRKSGNYQATIYRNGKFHALGTYSSAEDASRAYNEFAEKNPKKKRGTHGMRHSKIYRVWQNMNVRCYSSSSKLFHRYGGRGIFVCESWRNSFEDFYQDMKDGYSPDLQIDRINNEDGYYKENCRWVTRSVNCANKSNFTGVRKLPSGRFFASIKVEKTRYTIGTFDTYDEAARKFKLVHREWYGF